MAARRSRFERWWLTPAAIAMAGTKNESANIPAVRPTSCGSLAAGAVTGGGAGSCGTEVDSAADARSAMRGRVAAMPRGVVGVTPTISADASAGKRSRVQERRILRLRILSQLVPSRSTPRSRARRQGASMFVPLCNFRVESVGDTV